MTRKEWRKTLGNADPRKVMFAAVEKPRLPDLVETEIVKRDAALVAKEQAFLGMLDALNVNYRLPFRQGDGDALTALIEAKYDAAATDAARLAILKRGLGLVSRWQSFGAGVYDEHFGQASYEEEVRTPQYGKSPCELHGFEPYRDVFEVERELREVAP